MSYRGKTLLLGNAEVGKTSILARYAEGIFKDEYEATIGANFIVKEIDLSNVLKGLDFEDKEDFRKKGFKLYIWDICGQYDKLFVTEYYFYNALGAFVVFDITKEKSFNDINLWVEKMKSLSGDIPFVLVANKVDLKNDFAIEEREIEEKAQEYGVPLIKTSAKKNIKIDLAFETLAKLIIEKSFTE
ncbi:MAG: GTP-binding protein [Promethearchaeota archaeon]|nr:MAG: GTP-binding protein [Candidatus Lokiarchaeota archaeon]